MGSVKTIYLAGLISTEKQESLTWRLFAERWLKDRADELGKDIKILTPMRGKAGLERVSTDKGVTDPRLTSRDIILRDYHDVEKADVVLMNLNQFGSERPSVGTFMELAWAWELRKPVVAVLHGDEPEYLQTHPFIKESVSHLFENLSDACKFIVEQL